GADDSAGQNGNAYGLSIVAGSGGGGLGGGIRAGGGGGGGAIGVLFGGGGGGSNGTDGLQATGNTPARGTSHRFGGSVTPSGGNGGDGAGGGGAGVVSTSPTNQVDGEAGNGGYGGGGGGGAGIGAYDTDYESKGGSGGLGGGGGAGGVNHSGSTSAVGGNSNGGGGGGGAGPTDGSSALGGSDTGNLGGGSGGNGASSVGVGIGGGGGGGGSALGAAIFIDSNLNFTLEALSGIPTNFNTSNNTTQAGNHGTGASGATDGNDGSALGNSIFLRSGSSLTFSAQDVSDLLTLGNQVAFSDDTNFGGTGTSVFVSGNGTVTYNGTTDYQGHVTVNNANFKVNGQIDSAAVSICRNSGFSSQKGKLSGTGTMTGDVYVNSGTISPEAGGTLTLGSLTLNPPSVVHIDIDAVGTSLVSVNGNASLSGTLEITLNPLATAGTYIVLTASSLYSTFNTITFTGTTPNYTLSYLPVGAPTYVQFDLIDHGTTTSGSGVSGGTKNNFFGCTIGSTDNNSTGSFAFLITLFCSTLIVLRLRSLTTVQKYRSNKS
ncbi:MAG: hypothetical protein J0L93_05470, partial [Deltaproteobacteria bacterium]|nr:hypothetical protein [Deltaproteobacteria bacterium]